VKRLRLLTLAALAGIAALNLPLASPAAVSEVPGDARPLPENELSVMTYNVKGLPFPAAYGRADKLEEIGKRLGELRSAGRQPHVVLLQEAFIPEAKAIARGAGYTHVAIGPQIADVGSQVSDTDFAGHASWFRGEGIGKWVDSGLVILSDYPIVQTRKMAFPADLCAGFDCLAAKGVLLAWVKVPGHDDPIAIADTHLNSRKASGVGVARANAAYLGQVAALRGFIRDNVPSSTDLIFGGDFNTGHDKARIAAQTAAGGIVGGGSEATLAAATHRLPGMTLPNRAAILGRAKDKQYFRAGANGRLTLRAFDVPFGLGNGGSGLSDHLGYVADYAL